ncbi:MAG TPA: hypothetical protein VLI93_03880 [Acetobacteraceae bacterium]|nr:hypothetical protein [Acetobacteraceae bacterium]
MRAVAWIVPLLLLGLSGCVNVPPDNKTTVVQPTPVAPAVVAPAVPGTTVITRP